MCHATIYLIEKERDILMGASGKNQFRCHQGYHYPRSEKTIEECKTSFNEFNKYLLTKVSAEPELINNYLRPLKTDHFERNIQFKCSGIPSNPFI